LRYTILILLIPLYFPLSAQGSPTKAFVLSLVLPGGGQFYNGAYLKGGLFALGEGTLAYGVYWGQSRMSEAKRELDETRYTSSRRSRNDFIWGLIGLVFLSSLDAYVDAHLKEFEVNIGMCGKANNCFGFSVGVNIGFLDRF